MIKSSTPFDIDQVPVDKVLDYIVDTIEGIPHKKARLKIIKVLFQVLGYDLSPDAALMLASNPTHKLVIATAGAGKTTMTQVAIVMQKILYKFMYSEKLYGSMVLCLVYNDHNVDDMKLKHQSIVGRIRASGLGDFDVDDHIEATTLHSFCRSWLKQYSVECKVSDSELMETEEACASLMEEGFRLVAAKHKITEAQDFIQLYKMYTYAKECLLDYDSEIIKKKFPEVKLSLEAIKDSFNMYDGLKRKRKKFDFIDMIYLPYQLMLTNPQARQRISSNYKLVVTDEAQDFTPLMTNIVKLLTEQNHLIMIADEDQSIYWFKGADIENLLNFTSFFPQGEVYTLNYNRRCGDVIVDAATYIVSENTMRFEKKIKAWKKGGSIDLIPYSTEEGQLINLVRSIEKMTPSQRQNLAICYRDQIQSMVIVEMLEERGIPFYILSGIKPFSHELYGHVTSVMNALFSPFDIHAQLNLYKVLPINKKDWYTLLEYDEKKKTFSMNKERRHFRDIDYGRYANYKTFSYEMKVLVKVSEMIQNTPLNNYFHVVFDMLRKYYWNLKQDFNAENGRRSAKLDPMFTTKVLQFYLSPLTYDELFRKLSERKAMIRKNTENYNGIAIGTYHSMKGLEFEEVEMIYMDDGIFPSMDLGIRNSDEQELLELRESETRLCFMAMTRAKSKLRMRFYEPNPSYYIRRLIRYFNEKNQISEVVSIPEDESKTVAEEIAALAAPSTEAPVMAIEDDEEVVSPRLSESKEVIMTIEDDAPVEVSKQETLQPSGIGQIDLTPSTSSSAKPNFMDKFKTMF